MANMLQVLQGYKPMMGNEFDAFMGQLDGGQREVLRKTYNI